MAKNHQTLEAFEYRGKMFIYKYIIQMDQQRIVYSMLTVDTLVISSSLTMKSVVKAFQFPFNMVRSLQLATVPFETQMGDSLKDLTQIL